jgi:hypothetical protein
VNFQLVRVVRRGDWSLDVAVNDRGIVMRSLWRHGKLIRRRYGVIAACGDRVIIRRFRWRVWLFVAGRWRGIP